MIAPSFNFKSNIKLEISGGLCTPLTLPPTMYLEKLPLQKILNFFVRKLWKSSKIEDHG